MLVSRSEEGRGNVTCISVPVVTAADSLRGGRGNVTCVSVGTGGGGRTDDDGGRPADDLRRPETAARS